MKNLTALLILCISFAKLSAQNIARNANNAVLPYAAYYQDSAVFFSNDKGEMHIDGKLNLLAPNLVKLNNSFRFLDELTQLDTAASKDDVKIAETAWKAMFKTAEKLQNANAFIASNGKTVGAVINNTSKQWLDNSTALTAFANYDAKQNKSAVSLNKVDYLMRLFFDAEKSGEIKSEKIEFYEDGFVNAVFALKNNSEATLRYKIEGDELDIQALSLRLINPNNWSNYFADAKSVVAECHFLFYKFGIAAVQATFAAESNSGVTKHVVNLLPHYNYINLRYVPVEVRQAPLWHHQLLSADDTETVARWKIIFNQRNFNHFIPEVNDALAIDLKSDKAQPWVKLEELLKMTTVGKDNEKDFDEDWLDSDTPIKLLIEVVSYDIEIAKDTYIDRCYWVFNHNESNLPFSLVIDNYTERDTKDILTQFHDDICGKEAFEIQGNTFSQMNGNINKALYDYFYQ